MSTQSPAGDPDVIALNQLISRPNVYRNLHPAVLVEHSLRRGEGTRLAANGALVGWTGKRTGRSPKDKFTVKDAVTADKVFWGEVNQPFDAQKFEALYSRVLEYLKTRDLYVQDLFAGADPQYRLPIRVINEFAWHNLFVRDLFIRPTEEELQTHAPEFTVIAAPTFLADPQRDGTKSEVFILVNFSRRLVLIGGTHYAGEMKKSIFGVMNFLLPERDVFPMHCSANIGADGVAALFFGLSGTGKTTLSADPERGLIGDDEHGWRDRGIFNFEGGCYAKCIKLSHVNEPQIWGAIRFGAVLENLVLDAAGVPDYDDDRFTENTRAAYPVDFIENAVIPGVGGHPKNVVFLTADAFGVLPPVSRLTPEQAMYHFLSGYTAKVAGTEVGLTSPQVTFSTCFASPFLPLPPPSYAQMLHDKLSQHKSLVWLVNTGWTEGPQGQGHRIPLELTRAMVRAILDGALNDVSYTPHPIFRVNVPISCPGVPAKILQPEQTWKDTAA